MLHNIHSSIDLNTYCAPVSRDTALNKVLAPVELNITVKGLTNKRTNKTCSLIKLGSLIKLKISEKTESDGWGTVGTGMISLKRWYFNRNLN